MYVCVFGKVLYVANSQGSLLSGSSGVVTYLVACGGAVLTDTCVGVVVSISHYDT